MDKQESKLVAFSGGVLRASRGPTHACTDNQAGGVDWGNVESPLKLGRWHIVI